MDLLSTLDLDLRDEKGGPFPEGPPFSRLIPFVFLPGGDPTADMALGLVFIEYFLYLLIQPPVDGGQTFTQVFMYG